MLFSVLLRITTPQPVFRAAVVLYFGLELVSIFSGIQGHLARKRPYTLHFCGYIQTLLLSFFMLPGFPAHSVQPSKPKFSMRGVRIHKCCRTEKNKTTSCTDGKVWIPQLYHCTPNADAISSTYANKLH